MNAPARHDVLCVGNAIVDILSKCDDAFLQRHDIIKSAMNLVDGERSASLYDAMGPAIETGGGSAANTAAGIAALGGKAAYIGKVADDQLGEIFAHDIRALGVAFSVAPLVKGAATARSMIFVTPDGERSMNTFLGACPQLTVDDIDADLVADSAITYFEGYLWDAPEAKAAIRLAAKLAHEAGRKTALSLSDSFCVERFRGEFRDLITRREVDIVFANDSELLALYETDDLDAAMARIGSECELAAITLGRNGSSVVRGEGRHDVPVHPIDRRLDTTGAGDLFASGFLHALTLGMDLPDCAALGNFCAATIIEQMGPRPPVELGDMARQAKKLD